MNDLSVVHTAGAPAAIGPYSQAIVCNGFVFASGQIPMDPETMELVGGDVAAQTDRVMRKVAAVLEAAGASLNTVVKTTVFLADMGDFGAMNAVDERHFGEHKPARATVQAAGLPKAVDVEIEVIAQVR